MYSPLTFCTRTPNLSFGSSSRLSLNACNSSKLKRKLRIRPELWASLDVIRAFVFLPRLNSAPTILTLGQRFQIIVAFVTRIICFNSPFSFRSRASTEKKQTITLNDLYLCSKRCRRHFYPLGPLALRLVPTTAAKMDLLKHVLENFQILMKSTAHYPVIASPWPHVHYYFDCCNLQIYVVCRRSGL